MDTTRFLDFCKSFPGAECIDDLPVPPQSPDRADYFLYGRRIIVEVKSLEDDPNDKLVRFLRSSGINLPAGKYALSDVVKGHRDPDLEKKAWDKFTASISRALEKANSQIRDTKKILEIGEADGVLILFHGKVANLTPDIILARIQQRLMKQTHTGEWAHSHLTHIVLLSEIHKLKLIDGTMLSAIIPVANHGAVERFGTGAYISAVFNIWAQYLGRRNFVVPASALK